MLDNGDGAVRSGKGGFPGANIPANCSGTVTFERKESQTTLPVKSYQLVIDSCSVIDQQSGEMEMHLALIVDGYKFNQTGYYFRYLPNSIAQLALPEWELVSQPASPVSLGSIEIDPGLDLALTVVYSDNTQKVVLTDADHYKTTSSVGPGFDLSDGCDSITPYAEELPDGLAGETVEGNFYWGSCQMDGVIPKGVIIMEFGDYVAEYDASDNEDASFLYAPLADWVIQ